LEFSRFGDRFGRRAGIVSLMDDLGSALRENPDMIFMGGGNPGRIPEIETLFQQRLEGIMANPDERHALFGIYQSPQGDKDFRRQLAEFLQREYHWPLSEHNIAISNGSQSAFFVLFNLLAGEMPDGEQRSIHLPMAPEYIGYADAGLSPGFFTATRPEIQIQDDALFKYRVDFSTLQVGPSIGALCVSRPTNPTGNVLTDDELSHLDELANTAKIPLIIDGAYGLPFPDILFTEASPHWNENTVLMLSLSKLGLPGARTGILIGSEELIQAFTNANTIVSLACGTLGPALAKALFNSGEILKISRDIIKPFYQQRALQTVAWFQEAMAGLPCHIHRPEGAIFLWLWFQDLPITSRELYQRLKRRGVLVVPGEDFFVGINGDWPHRHECLRVSYAQDSQRVRAGVQLIAEEARRAYEAAA